METWGSFLAGGYINMLRGCHSLTPWGEGMEAVVLDSPRLCPMCIL